MLFVYGDVEMRECPVGFCMQHRSLYLYIEIRKAIEAGIPPIYGLGLLEYPNKVTQAVGILDEELGSDGGSARKLKKSLK